MWLYDDNPSGASWDEMRSFWNTLSSADRRKRKQLTLMTVRRLPQDFRLWEPVWTALLPWWGFRVLPVIGLIVGIVVGVILKSGVPLVVGVGVGIVAAIAFKWWATNVRAHQRAMLEAWYADESNRKSLEARRAG